MRNPRPHIIIIGAGPAGSTCAIALLALGCQVTIIDSGRAGKFHIGESISPDMNSLLRTLGIYTEFLKIKKTPCFGSCSYWGSELRGYNDSVLSPYGHGWHLDRNEFDKFLIDEARRRGAKVEVQSTFKAVTIDSRGVAIMYQNALKEAVYVNGDFVVDASGSRSVVSTHFGSRKINDISLICLARRFRMGAEMKVPFLTHLESVEHGWWYAASVPDDTFLVSFYSTAGVVRHFQVNKLDQWMSLLNDAPRTSALISGVRAEDSHIIGFPTDSFCLEQIAGERWVAIGDAASTFDPITANGILKSVTHGINVAPAIFRFLNSSNRDELLVFEESVRQEHNTYKRMRSQFYKMENRWPDGDFWKVMHNIEESVAV